MNSVRRSLEHKPAVPHHPASSRGRKPSFQRQPKDILKRNLDERMQWLVIDIPCWSGGAQRKQPSEATECDDAYSDDEFIIDRSGIRRVSTSLTHGILDDDQQARTPSVGGGSWSENGEDDCASQASTRVGDGGDVFNRYTQSPLSCKRSVKLENLQKQDQIGRGSSGVVWRAIDKSVGRDSSCTFAVKEMALEADELKRQIMVDELRTSHRVHHACIVTCHEVFFSKGVFSLVLEYMDAGSLLDALKSAALQGDRRGLPCAALACVGRGVAEALAYLHEDELTMHRDVKPSNILLSRSGAVKLGDLGICTRPGEVPSPAAAAAAASASAASAGGCAAASAAAAAPSATQWIGTVTYMSPERIFGEVYSYNADVWSLGVVLAEAGMCRYPYALPPSAAASAASADGGGQRLQFWDLLDMVVDGPCPSAALAAELPAADGRAHQDAVDLVAWCLTKDLRARPAARELLDHPFLAPLAAPEAAAAARASLVTWLAQAAADPAPSSAQAPAPSTATAASSAPAPAAASAIPAAPAPLPAAVSAVPTPAGAGAAPPPGRVGISRTGSSEGGGLAAVMPAAAAAAADGALGWINNLIAGAAAARGGGGGA